MVGGAEQNACRPAVRAHGDAACTAGLAETAPTGTHSGGPGRGTLWPGAAGFGMGPGAWARPAQPMTGLSRNAVISSAPSSEACARPIAIISAPAASVFCSGRCLAG